MIHGELMTYIYSGQIQVTNSRQVTTHIAEQNFDI